ncbi:MAG: hypothetical protein GY821_14485 [Gammaproteobacteria bacterium]|nr:hypothetical protein [Gammaproteobacteria bacterium]
MPVALLIVPAVTLYHLGGFAATLKIVNSKSEYFLHPFHKITAISAISMLANGLGYFGQPHLLVRFMAIRNHRAISQAKFICLGWTTLSILGAIATGFFAIAFFSRTPLEKSDEAFIILVKTLFNPWIAGVLLSNNVTH